MLEQMIERQKLIRIIDLSDLMYLKRKSMFIHEKSLYSKAILILSTVHLPPQNSIHHGQCDQGQTRQTTSYYECH